MVEKKWGVPKLGISIYVMFFLGLWVDIGGKLGFGQCSGTTHYYL
jgi:hypothetical protein